MKLKKTILGLAVVAVAGVNAFNAVSSEQSKLSDLQMENIEALACTEAYLAQCNCTDNRDDVCHWSCGKCGRCYSYWSTPKENKN